MKLPVCPDCGRPPEFWWKDNSFGSCFGALKCPNYHYRVEHGYWAGGKNKAKHILEEQWVAAVNNSEVKNG